MSKINLVFPSGRSVKRVKQDAKAWAKGEKVPLHEALDKMAIANGIDASWQKALSLLQQAAATCHPTPPADKPAASSLLALELGLTDEELMQLHWDMDTRESSDGLIYSYIIQFSDDNPTELLDKIDGLSDHNSVEVSANAFDEPEPPADPLTHLLEEFGGERGHFTNQDLVSYVQSQTRGLSIPEEAYFYVAESEDCPGYFNILIEAPNNQAVRFMPNALESVACEAVAELNALR